MDLSSMHSFNSGYFEATIDSAAARPVVPLACADHCKVEETPESKRGASFRTANGALVKNLGCRRMDVTTDSGEHRTVKADVADIHKVLLAVSAMCDKGHRVTFRKHGGEIVHEATGKTIKMVRKNGVYVVGLTLNGKNKEFHDLCANEQGNEKAGGKPANHRR